ncbi:trypsin-like peptidase domain-containing protein [Luedemannella flava]
MGAQVRVGRDPRLEAPSEHPMVAPGQHGVLTSDPDGATWTDTSERGSYRDGKRIKGALRVTEPVVLRLGDPATGEELGITPPLTIERMQAGRRRRGTIRALTVVAGALCLLMVAGIGTVLATRDSNRSADTAAAAPATTAVAPGAGSDAPSGLSPQALHRAETATVRLLQGAVDNNSGWGSGTIVSADGLILTNAHVAAPRAPGLAVALATPASTFDPDPPFLTVEFIEGDDSAAQARYRARPVAVDGYLDLAVVEIFADAAGNPVDRRTLNLPFMEFGDVGKVRLGQSVTILGFPGVSGSDTITVTTGVISTFIRDPLKHVDDARFEMETTARVAHGNSGGAAITDTGELIGVPSLAIPGQGSDLSWRLRSVTQARPLLDAARDGRTYRSELLVPLGDARVTGVGIGADPAQACGGNASLPSGITNAVFGFRYEGARPGLDVAFLLLLPDGTTVRTGASQNQAVPGLPEAVIRTPTGCVAYQVNAAGGVGLPDGTYQAQLLGGENLDPMGPAATLRVGG